MRALKQTWAPLVAGEKLSREEFLRRWELRPDIKNAELIAGVVYVSSPVSLYHGSRHAYVVHWLIDYEDRTPGCAVGDNATWLMLADAPQPDAHLRILPEYGGQSRVQDLYGEGAPELVVEVCLSSSSHDLGPKLELYRSAGVQEYITILLKESQVIWRRLAEGGYVGVAPDADGILRSAVFPGLWLDPQALLNKDRTRLMEVLNRGLESSEHAGFVRQLAARRG